MDLNQNSDSLIAHQRHASNAENLNFDHSDSEVRLLAMDACDGGADLIHLYKTPLRPNELPDAAKKRLDTLISSRRDHEDVFPQPIKKKKTDAAFDLTRFLTEAADEDDVSTKPQQEEAAFIIRCFRDPICLQFRQQMAAKGCESANVCSLCGLTKEFHVKRRSPPPHVTDGGGGGGGPAPPPGHRPPAAGDAADPLLMAAATKHPLMVSRPASEARDVIGGHGDEADFAELYTSPMEQTTGSVSKSPALTFGSVQIPLRFVCHPSNTTKERYMRKYLKFDVNDAGSSSTIARLWELLTRIWQLPAPAVAFSVTGGRIPEDKLPAMQSLAAAMTKITSQTDCWILSDSRNRGTSRYLGRMMMHAGDGQQAHSPVFLGSTHWGSLKRKELLLGISLPCELKSSQYFYAMEYSLWQEESYEALNPYQAVYLLLDNGRPDPGDCCVRFRRRFEEYLKSSAAKNVYNLGDVTLPVVTLVIGGDEETLDQVLYSVEHKDPVILVNNSGEIPGILAQLYYHLEDAYPRTWNENADWKETERIAFSEFFDAKEETIRRIFQTESADRKRHNGYQGNRMRKVKKVMQDIMQERYYVTVIDSGFESDESLHGSILQGIYKGYSRRSGLAIALKTATYDFLQALFLRDVDPQFTKEEYVSIRSLNHFHLENLFSENSISKALKLMCKRDTLLDKLDPEVSVLPVIGRVLQRLLGPRYRVLYQEEQYNETAWKRLWLQCSHGICLFHLDGKNCVVTIIPGVFG